MTQEERIQRLNELREELKSSDRLRSREAIIMEGKTLKIAYEMERMRENVTKVLKNGKLI